MFNSNVRQSKYSGNEPYIFPTSIVASTVGHGMIRLQYTSARCLAQSMRRGVDNPRNTALASRLSCYLETRANFGCALIPKGSD